MSYSEICMIGDVSLLLWKIWVVAFVYMSGSTNMMNETF